MPVAKTAAGWRVRLQIGGVKYCKSLGKGSTRRDAMQLETKIRKQVIGVYKARGLGKEAKPPATKTAPVQYLYRHFDDEGRLLYVGISISAILRLLQHKSTAPWYESVATITIERYATREEVRAAERRAILTEHPAHNAPIPPAREIKHRPAYYMDVPVLAV